MTDIANLSATALLDLYRRHDLSPLEYFDHLEAHIAAWEPRLCALYAFDPERARREAQAATERWARDAPLGVLDGVPVTIKELIATKGDPVPQGTVVTAPTPAERDAPPAARVKEAGAIAFAKTTCPDFGMLSSGLSSFHPLSRNPWDLRQNPGGSSAGAGAAAGAGYGPLHIGTDIGGSVRLPAAWCGVVGFKPTLGRIPIDPYYVGRCAGPMTRTVADAALMMSVLSRPDRRDAMSLPPAEIDWMNLERSVRGLRLGLMLDAGCGLAVDDEVGRAVTSAAQCFADMGAIIETVPPLMNRAMLDGLDVYWRARLWGEIERYFAEERRRILPYILEWAAAGAEVSGVEAVRGFNQTFAIRGATAALFERVDAVLSPVTPVASFPAEWPSPTNDPARPFEHIAFTVPWNMGEQPAIAINCGFTRAGMPTGLQIAAPRFEDLFVLQLARAFEAEQAPIRWPQPPR